MLRTGIGNAGLVPACSDRKSTIVALHDNCWLSVKVAVIPQKRPHEEANVTPRLFESDMLEVVTPHSASISLSANAFFAANDL